MLKNIFTSRGGCGCGKQKATDVVEPKPKAAEAEAAAAANGPKPSSLCCSSSSSWEKDDDDRTSTTTFSFGNGSELQAGGCSKTADVALRQPMTPEVFGDSTVAVVKDSEDPYGDFRQSMVQMIVEREMHSKDDLRELLRCFLDLNSSSHHKVIVEAFVDIWNEILSKNHEQS